VSEHTILATDDRGTIKCRECGQKFPHHSPPSSSCVGGRSVWSLLREHVTKRHHALSRELARGIVAWDRENSAILAEGRALCAPEARTGGSRGD
jgi:transcription elongation factor Elf1